MLGQCRYASRGAGAPGRVGIIIGVLEEAGRGGAGAGFDPRGQARAAPLHKIPSLAPGLPASTAFLQHRTVEVMWVSTGSEERMRRNDGAAKGRRNS